MVQKRGKDTIDKWTVYKWVILYVVCELAESIVRKI